MLVKSAKIILIIYQKNTTDKLREREREDAGLKD